MTTPTLRIEHRPALTAGDAGPDRTRMFAILRELELLRELRRTGRQCDCARSMLRLAVLFCDNRDSRCARALLMTAAGISPRAFTSDAFFEIHPRLGDLVHDVFVDAARRLLAAGEHHRAVDLLQTLSSRGNPNALVALAECYARQGDYHATMQTLSAAVDVLERSPDPGDDEVWHRLLELTLRIEPDDEEARRRLAKLEMRRGKFDAAMGHAAAVVRLAPHDTTSLELVAECLIRAGRTGAGVAALRSILVRHLEAGRHAWARQTLAQAEAWNPAWPEYQDALRALGQRLDLADPKRPPSPQADARSWVNQQRPGRSVSGTIVVEWAA